MRLRICCLIKQFRYHGQATSQRFHSNSTKNNQWTSQQAMKISQSSSSSATPKINVATTPSTPGGSLDNLQNVLRDEIHELLSVGTSTKGYGYQTNDEELKVISKYYFDGRGKALRPRISLTLADAVNSHIFGHNDTILTEEIMKRQRQVAMIAEMYHTGSLYHDDVIDKSEERRSRESVNSKWGSKHSIMSGDYVISMANKLLGQLGDEEVIFKILSC